MPDAIWSLNLLETAARGCPATFLWLGLGIEILVLAAAAARPRMRPSAVLLVLGAAAAALAWVARDRLLLLGDGRVWVRNAEVFGSHLPVYRAPLFALVWGPVADALRRWAGAREVLAAVSVLAGVGAASALWSAVRAEAPAQRRPSVAAILMVAVFCQPMSFLFYGHVEAYPFLLALFALLLAALKRDLAAGGAPWRSGAAFLATVLAHLSGALAAVPLAAWIWARWRGRRGRLAPRYLALLAAAALAVFAVPATRDHTFGLRGWTAAGAADYALDVLNGWFLLFFPFGLLAWRVRARVLADDFGRLLALLVVTFALFPLLAYFELGLYRDLDLLGPAFIALTLFCVIGVAREPAMGWRSVAVYPLAGGLLLAGVQTLALCPAGVLELERQLRRGAMSAEAKANTAEILAFHERERGDLPAAEAKMREAVSFAPGNLRLWGPLGEIQLARGDTAAAVESLEKTMATPRAPRSAPLLAEIHTRRGRPEDALRVLGEIAETVPYDARASAALAVAYFRAGLPESTLAVTERRLQLAPDDDVARFNAAAAWSRLGSLERAAENLAEAARIRPENRQYHLQLLRVLLALPDGEARAGAYLRSLTPALAESLRTQS